MGPATGRVDKVERPTTVTASGWIVIVVSGLLLITDLVSAPRTLERSGGVLFLVGGLIYAVVRLIAGAEILKGRNWARIAYLIGDLLVLNLGTVLLNKSTSSPWSADTVSSLFACLSYLIVLILLTRRPALLFFGRPAEPAMKARRVALALVLFCIAYGVTGRIAAAFGASSMSIVSDRWNPISALCNAVGEQIRLPMLQSSTYAEQQTLVKSIHGAGSLDEVGDIVGSSSYDAHALVAQHDTGIAFVWIVNLIGVAILARRR
jgi:hypothetical protein